MYVRHGPFFTDRLLIHDHINRLTSGVHGDTGSIQYFMRQLGYGAFPWIGLVPLGFVAWLYLRAHDERDEAAGSAQRRTAHPARAVVGGGVHAVQRDDHQVPPLHLPGRAAARAADRAWCSIACSATARSDARKRALGHRAGVRSRRVPLVLGVAGFYGDVRGVIPEDVDAAQHADLDGRARPATPLVACALIALGARAAASSALRLLRHVRRRERCAPARPTPPSARRCLASARVAGASRAAT